MTIVFNAPDIRIHHARWQDVLPGMPDDSVDLVVTDPPYSHDTHVGARRQGKDDERAAEVLIDDDRGFDSADVDAQRAWLAAVGRVCKRWVIATMDWQHALPLKQHPPDGLRFVRMGAWVKDNGMPQVTGDRPAQGWEAILYFHRSVERCRELGQPGKMRWNGGGRSSVVRCPVEHGEHPTCKPVKLIRQLIELFSEPGDLVLDPFCGGGTTLRAAKDCGRKAIGIEMDERWTKTCIKRLAQGTLLC